MLQQETRFNLLTLLYRLLNYCPLDGFNPFDEFEKCMEGNKNNSLNKQQTYFTVGYKRKGKSYLHTNMVT
jgi:hypothetical protein